MHHRRLLATVAPVVGALALAGCFTNPGASPPPPSAERAECEAGVAQAVHVLGPRVTASVVCLSGIRGYYDAGSNTAFVGYYERDLHQGPYEYAGVAAHELGHAWDRWAGVPSASARYAEVRGNAGLPWCDLDASDGVVPGRCEDYADVFVNLTFRPGYRGYGFPPVTDAQRAALCGEGLVPC